MSQANPASTEFVPGVWAAASWCPQTKPAAPASVSAAIAMTAISTVRTEWSGTSAGAGTKSASRSGVRVIATSRSGVGRVTGRARVGLERGVGAAGAELRSVRLAQPQVRDEPLDPRIGGRVEEQLVAPGLQRDVRLQPGVRGQQH